jgi:hypothetical protein
MAVGHNLRDAQLKVTRALPAAASATVNADSIDLGNGPRGDFNGDHEVLVSAPAVNTTMAPDTRTFTYSLHDSADNSSFAAIAGMSGVIVQTGAGGVGAAAATFRCRLPAAVRRYLRLVIVSGASTADASAVSATIELLL